MIEKLEKYIILVVNGYGCHLDTPLGRIYLPRVAKLIREHHQLILAIILCGGFTQRKSAPGISEAALMKTYLKDYVPYQILPLIITEEDSYTSYDNSEKAALKIFNVLWKLHPGLGDITPNLRIVNFCEATRSANVIMLDRHFMLKFVESIDDITVETASWERADPFKQAGNLIYNKLALHFPYFACREREKRLRRAEFI